MNLPDGAAADPQARAQAFVTEHLDTLWARVGDTADPESLAVGAFRSVLAGPATPTRRALLDAAETLARRHARGSVTAMGGASVVPAGHPARHEPPVNRVLERVCAPTDPAPTLTTARRVGRRVRTASVVVVLVGLALVIWRQRSDAPPAQADRAPAAVSAVNQVEIAAGAAARAASTAGDKIAARSGFPSTGDLLLDQHLARCAAAVDSSGQREQYPPVSTWTVTASQVGRTGVATAVNATFFCATTPTTVSVSAPGDAPAGPVRLVQVGRYEVGVLNPGAGVVTLVVDGVKTVVAGPAALVGVSGPTTAVAVVAPTRPRDPAIPAVRAATAITLLDAPVSAAQDRTSPAGRRLVACLSGETGALVPDPQAWFVVDDSRPRVLLVAAHGMVGVCVSGSDGAPQVMTVQPVPDPPAAGTLAVAINLGAVGGAAESYLVLSVDPDATRIGGDRGGIPLACTVNRGVGLCAARSSAPGLTRLTATTLDGVVVAGPVRQ